MSPTTDEYHLLVKIVSVHLVLLKLPKISFNHSYI